MTDQDPNAAGQPGSPPPPGEPPSPPQPPYPPEPVERQSHVGAIVAGVFVVLLLGVLTALVIDRGDAGATANTSPGVSVDVHRTTSTTNITTTVAAPPA